MKKGEHVSEETRERMRAAHRERWRKKKLGESIIPMRPQADGTRWVHPLEHQFRHYARLLWWLAQDTGLPRDRVVPMLIEEGEILNGKAAA